MKRTIAFIISAFFMAVSSFPSFAQRQTYGRTSVEAYGSFGEIHANGYMGYFLPAGGGFNVSKYDYNWRWVLGADVLCSPHDYNEEAIYDKEGNLIAKSQYHILESTEICGAAGFLYRVWATRSRSLCVSAGASLLLGIKAVPEMGKFYNPLTGDYCKTVGFFLAGMPEIQVEYFPFTNISFFGSLRPRMRMVEVLPGKSGWFRMNMAFGAKIYL